ncbi:MAG: hypothetical protein HW393_391, partial [Dehalococcoidia bacterium]|nr:hypothetical protein [Dehalococcoidia bacterium]
RPRGPSGYVHDFRDGTLGRDHGMLTSRALLVPTLPTLLVYIFLGRFFMRGLMAGALRG